MTTLPAPSKRTIDTILKNIPNLKNLQKKDPGSKEVYDALGVFISVIYATDFVISFDWMAEFPRETLDINQFSTLENADARQLRKLLIAHLRLDRFEEGHLKRLLFSGYLNKLMERFRALRATL